MDKITSFEKADLEDLGPGKYFKTSKDELGYSDFFWDRGVVISATVVIALSILDFSSAITGDSVRCLTPINFTRDQVAFVNSFCSEYTPPTDYFPIFLAGEGFVLGGLHFLWWILMFGKISSFASVVDSLDRHKYRKIGDFTDKNYIKMRLLKRSFKGRFIYLSYLFKLLCQIILTYFTMVICAVEFTDFNSDFDCPKDLSVVDRNVWLLNTTVPCVLEVLRSHRVAWIVNYVLVKAIFALSLFGLVKCLWTHARELSYQESGKFCFQYGLPLEHCYFPTKRPYRWFWLDYRITSDLDFLLVRLYSQDVGRAMVLRELLVSQYVKDSISEIQEALTLLKPAKREPHDCDKKLIDDLKLPSELMKPGEKLQSFANYLTYLLYKSDAVNSDRVVTHIDMDVVTFEACFGTQGFAYKLALVVNQIISLRFDPYYNHEKEPVEHGTFKSGICVIRTNSNIYSQPTMIRRQVDEMFGVYLKKEPPTSQPTSPQPRSPQLATEDTTKKIKFIIIGAFVDRDRIVTLHMILHTVEHLLDPDARLIIVVPSKINGNDVSKQFQTFYPRNVTNKDYVVHNKDLFKWTFETDESNILKQKTCTCFSCYVYKYHSPEGDEPGSWVAIKNS